MRMSAHVPRILYTTPADPWEQAKQKTPAAGALITRARRQAQKIIHLLFEKITRIEGTHPSIPSTEPNTLSKPQPVEQQATTPSLYHRLSRIANGWAFGIWQYLSRSLLCFSTRFASFLNCAVRRMTLIARDPGTGHPAYCMS